MWAHLIDETKNIITIKWNDKSNVFQNFVKRLRSAEWKSRRIVLTYVDDFDKWRWEILAIDSISFLISILISHFFFTYSEALPALRLRRVDIFGPPVGSALNSPQNK